MGEELDRNITLSQSKINLFIGRLQNIHTLIPNINDKNKQQFLAKARTIDDMRFNFNQELDKFNLYQLTKDPDYQVDFKSLDQFEDLYGEIMLKLDSFRFCKASEKETKSQSDHIKIPRIELPTFDGDIQNFPFFFETFKKLIHENTSLTDSDRIHYLLNQLTGKAKSICIGVVPSGENYNNLWETLISKYEDKRALGTSYLNQLFALKPIQNPSPANLEKLIDRFSSTIDAFKQLKLQDTSEFIFIYMGLKLLDLDTAKQFEMSIRSKTDLPTYEEFIKFIREQVKILERTNSQKVKIDHRISHAHVATMKTEGQTEIKCPVCNSNHHRFLYQCDQFTKLNASDRFQFIKDKGWCIVCLGKQHTASRCQSDRTCRKCKRRHHSLLHFNGSVPTQTALAIDDIATETACEEEEPEELSESETEKSEVSLCTMSSTNHTSVHTTEVLATAQVMAIGRNNKDVQIRCLLDPGSQKHYVTNDCCRKLGLPVRRGPSVSVKGIGGVTQMIKGKVNLTIRSKLNPESKYEIEALVLELITDILPTCQIDVTTINSFRDIPLADQTWASPGPIDALLGVKLFADLLLPGKVMTEPGLPDALETVLGYIVVGDAPTCMSPSAPVSFCATYEVGNLIKRFWEIEDMGSAPVLSNEEKQAEEFYQSTCTRDETGRYEVALPFKLDPSHLGDSLKMAERRQINLERKFKAQPKLREMYNGVINDHIDKEYLSPTETKSENACYIAHHGVLREDKSTTPLRMVLDASAATSSGLSLNDLLHAGPSLQADLFCILLNLRLFPVALSADVRQMYLAIKVRECDRAYQRILYRFDDLQPLQSYQYNRVAFGLRCSPFLALRTIKQLAIDEGAKYPIAKEILSRDIYMDDIASSVINEEQARTAAQELFKIFQSGGFQLAKWSSNSNYVLQDIPKELKLSQSVSFDDETTLKILGLRWFPKEDLFSFQVTPDERPCTKRNILSSIARLFDVLGLVAPIIVFAKLLIKELWIAKIDWDEVPPDHITRKWRQFQAELPLISQLKFPRHIAVAEACSLTILGFADASERAYGGMVYAYVKTPDNKTSINLVCAKSKVAPLKVVSLARLELCALLLLAQLINKVIENYSPRFPIQSILAFSDSTVALCWVHSPPYQWQTFVANRVAKIQDLLPSSTFFHVKGTDNPSDCLSRGLTPAQLVDHPMWLHGAPWMKLPKNSWPIKPFVPNNEDVPEAKTLAAAGVIKENIIIEMAKRFSSWPKYVRSVAYVLKFIKKLPKGTITATDLEVAENEIIAALQDIHFKEDIVNLKNGTMCTGSLKQLKPFMENRLIRVGGRLGNSSEDYAYKHPILLPRSDHIVEILIDYYHRKNCHVGPETLMSLLRQRYWIMSARRIIRQRIHRCNFCFRLKPKATFPMMAELPASRVNQVEKAFTHTGCDYAGPIQYVPHRRRGVRSQKAYICVFTCLTTRAIHIEVATDLSTANFLAAFQRFLSRRGPVNFMYSDNGTNFIGTKSYLKELHEFLTNEYRELWEQELAQNHITWKNICPNAPHHGGCWESEVKSVKTLLFRTIGPQILSYEELITVLAQIEAVLNSRPLYTMSADPSEPTALTPAHFLNTTPLKYLPATAAGNVSDHLLKRHQILEKIVRDFWNRWRKEYLHTLQNRRKWNTPSNPVKEGTVVLIIKDNVMPLHWPLGVVVQTFPGKDGVTRIVKVRTKQGFFQRPTVKLCPLPSQ